MLSDLWETDLISSSFVLAQLSRAKLLGATLRASFFIDTFIDGTLGLLIEIALIWSQ